MDEQTYIQNISTLNYELDTLDDIFNDLKENNDVAVGDKYINRIKNLKLECINLKKY